MRHCMMDSTRRPVALIAFLVAIELLTSNIDSIQCYRYFKDNLKPRSKCVRNFTTSDQDNAQSNRKCIALNNPYCFDIRLPYNSTFVPDYLADLNLRSFEEVHNYLELWNGVKNLPKCWPVIQVALCSILMPQCDEDPQTGHISRVYRSNADICNDLVYKNDCRFIERRYNWTTIFNCSDNSIYDKNCTNELRDLKFAAGSKLPTCQYPLVASTDATTWFKDVDGCSLHCKFPVSSQQDQAYLSAFIWVMTLIGLFSTISAILLFRANKTRSQSSRMAKVIKHCNKCQLLYYLGWSLQIILNDDVACKPNGSASFGQPLVASSCVLSFLLTYVPSLSCLLWCAHLGRLCHIKMVGRSQSSKAPIKSGLSQSLSLLNYGIPLTLFVGAALVGQIDGHGLYGICTVGLQSTWIRVIFVFIPVVVSTTYGNFYFIRIIFKLLLVNSTIDSSLRRHLMRISALSTLTIMQAIFIVANHYYEFANKAIWHDAIDDYVSCNLNLQYDYFIGPAADMLKQPVCQTIPRPIMSLYYMELFSSLALGLVISSWSFHESNFQGLRRKLIDILEDEKDRQRRVNTFLKAGLKLDGRTYAELPAVLDNISDEEEGHRDLIDMTLTARRVNADQPNSTELGDIANAPDNMSRRTSLRSASLASFFGHTNASITGNIPPHLCINGENNRFPRALGLDRPMLRGDPPLARPGLNVQPPTDILQIQQTQFLKEVQELYEYYALLGNMHQSQPMKSHKFEHGIHDSSHANKGNQKC